MRQIQRSKSTKNATTSPKPLSQLQGYLVEAKVSMALLREVLLELKDTLVVVTIILFFILGVARTLGH